jgi:hypothetical protein
MSTYRFCRYTLLSWCYGVVGLFHDTNYYLALQLLKLPPHVFTLSTSFVGVKWSVSNICAPKNVVFWDVTLFGHCKNRHFGGTYRLHHQDDKNQRARSNFNSN